MTELARKQYIKKRREVLDEEIDQVEVDTSAIGDISFLLLIFFIVTSSFLLKQGLPFSLPPENAKPQRVKSSELIELKPLEDGYLYQNSFATVEVVSSKLNYEKKINADPIILIKMDKKLPYRRFVDALSLVQENKITKISVETGGK